MDNLKLWISQSGFSVPNYKICMFILLLILKKMSVTQFAMWRFEDYCLSNILWEKFKISYSYVHSLIIFIFVRFLIKLIVLIAVIIIFQSRMALM